VDFPSGADIQGKKQSRRINIFEDRDFFNAVCLKKPPKMAPGYTPGRRFPGRYAGKGQPRAGFPTHQFLERDILFQFACSFLDQYMDHHI
jgi:hypothetical protein